MVVKDGFLIAKQKTKQDVMAPTIFCCIHRQMTPGIYISFGYSPQLQPRIPPIWPCVICPANRDPFHSLPSSWEPTPPHLFTAPQTQTPRSTSTPPSRPFQQARPPLYAPFLSPPASTMRKRSSIVSLQKAEAEAEAALRRPRVLVAIASLFPLLAALYYIAASVSLTLFNKLLFSRFPGSDPPFLLLSQSITAVGMLTLLRLLGKFTPPQIFSWPRASFRVYAPLFVSNLAMLLTSLVALKFTSLLMYNTLRRTSMIFVVAIHCTLHKTRPSPYTVGATALVTVGALIASSTDLAYDPLGYALAFTANISTAIYLVLLRPVRDKLQLSNLQLIYVNALVNVPVLFGIILMFPADEDFVDSFEEPLFLLLFFCSCALAVVINHAIFVNTTTNDAIAQSISSQLKDVVLLITSVFFVDDASQRAAGNLQGVFVGFLGSVVYGIGKLLERRASRKADEEGTRLREGADRGASEGSEKIGLIGAEVKSVT